jgi:hypothetical protein
MNALSRRWWMYLFLLVFSIAASIWVTVRGPRTVSAATASASPMMAKSLPQIAKNSSALEIPVRYFPEPAPTSQYRDPFSAPTPKAAPPPPTQAAQRVLPPPPPTAPPLPFTFRGILTDEQGTWIVQLARGNEFILMGRGEIIDATYRLNDFKNDELFFTYLPLSVDQTLSTALTQP